MPPPPRPSRSGQSNVIVGTFADSHKGASSSPGVSPNCSAILPGLPCEKIFSSTILRHRLSNSPGPSACGPRQPLGSAQKAWMPSIVFGQFHTTTSDTVTQRPRSIARKANILMNSNYQHQYYQLKNIEIPIAGTFWPPVVGLVGKRRRRRLTPRSSRRQGGPRAPCLPHPAQSPAYPE